MKTQAQKFFDRFKMRNPESRVNVPFSGDAYGTKYFNAVSVVRDDIYICRLSIRHTIIFFLILFFITILGLLIWNPEAFSWKPQPLISGMEFNHSIWPFFIATKWALIVIPIFSTVHAGYFFFYRGKNFNRYNMMSKRWHDLKGSIFNTALIFLTCSFMCAVGYVVATLLPILVLVRNGGIIFYPLLVLASILCYGAAAFYMTMALMRLFPLSIKFRLHSEE